MPEQPDLLVYQQAFADRIGDRLVGAVIVGSLSRLFRKG